MVEKKQYVIVLGMENLCEAEVAGLQVELISGVRNWLKKYKKDNQYHTDKRLIELYDLYESRK